MASLDLPSETWLKSTKLKESGLQIKSGKFSNDEKARLRDAVERYKEEHDISEEQLQLLIYKRRAKPNHADRVFVSGHKDMWKEIAKALPDRSVESSYRCVQRMYDAMANKGKWTADEDQMLQDLVLYHGTNWGSIAPQIGRTIGACADRWRVLERTQNELATGKWSADEDRAFASALEELTAEGRIPDSKDTSFWVEMSKRIPSRTIIQIRQKWVRQAHIQTLPDGQRTVEKVGRWNAECDFLLLGKLQALDVQDDSEIDWAKFRDDRLVWPPNKIRDGYLRLKKRVNPEEKTFAMIVADIAQYLSDRRAKRLAKIREPREPKQQLSAERVEEEWDDDDLYYEGLQLEADATFLDALERLGVRLTLPGDAAEEEANVMPWHDMGVSLSAIEGQGQGSREQAVEKGGEEDERERRKKKKRKSRHEAEDEQEDEDEKAAKKRRKKEEKREKRRKRKEAEKRDAEIEASPAPEPEPVPEPAPQPAVEARVEPQEEGLKKKKKRREFHRDEPAKSVRIEPTPQPEPEPEPQPEPPSSEGLPVFESADEGDREVPELNTPAGPEDPEERARRKLLKKQRKAEKQARREARAQKKAAKAAKKAKKAKKAAAAGL